MAQPILDGSCTLACCHLVLLVSQLGSGDWPVSLHFLGGQIVVLKSGLQPGSLGPSPDSTSILLGGESGRRSAGMMTGWRLGQNSVV